MVMAASMRGRSGSDITSRYEPDDGSWSRRIVLRRSVFSFGMVAGVDVTGVVLTKLDGSAKGGIVFAIESELGIPVKLVGLGEGVDEIPFGFTRIGKASGRERG